MARKKKRQPSNHASAAVFAKYASYCFGVNDFYPKRQNQDTRVSSGIARAQAKRRAARKGRTWLKACICAICGRSRSLTGDEEKSGSQSAARTFNVGGGGGLTVTMSGERRLAFKRLYSKAEGRMCQQGIAWQTRDEKLGGGTHGADDQDGVVFAAAARLVDDLEVFDGDGRADGVLELYCGDHRRLGWHGR